MGNPTVLLLGGSSDQLLSVRTARQMGFRTIVVDRDAKAPGLTEADVGAVVSTLDVPALKEFVDGYRAQTGPIDGVFVQGSDIPHIAAQLADHLDTPHMPVAAAHVAVHKLQMKQRFAENGVAVPWFAEIPSLKALERTISERGLPLILKPVDRSGARGVFLLQPGMDMASLYAASVAASYCGRVMVEEYIRGPQISTESVVFEERVVTPGFVDRNYEYLGRFAPHIIENGGWTPSAASKATRTAVDALIAKAARALEVSAGIVKGDIVVGPDGPLIIEMAARASGGDFSESLILHGIGVNIIEAGLNIAVGRTPNLDALKPRFQRAIGNRYFFPRPGRLDGIRGAEEVLAKTWVRKLQFWYAPGDLVPAVRSHADRFGVFVVEADDRLQLESRIAWVYETIEIEIHPTVDE